MPSRLSTHRGLVALRAPLPIDPVRELPARLVLLRWGKNETAEGPVIVNETTLAASRQWPQSGFGEVAIDFGHNTVPGHEAYQGEPAKVAARSAMLSVVPGEGLIASNIQWTDEGRAHREHYPDLSPAVKLNDRGEVTFCHSAALCRNGAVRDLHLFSANEAMPEIDLQALCDALGLPATSNIDEINAAIAKLLVASQEVMGKVQTQEDASPELRTMGALLTKLGGNFTTLGARFDTASATDHAVMRQLGISEADWRRHN